MKILLSISDSARNVLYFGTATTSLFWSCIVYGYIGALVLMLIHIGMRKKESANSPTAFSMKYYMQDNWARILVNILLVALAIRFLPQALGHDMNQWWSLLVGLGSDLLASRFKGLANSAIGVNNSNPQ